MKILTKEQEREHYHATLRGGFTFGGAGLGLGFLGVYAASRRYHFFRNLTLPLKAFLITSAGTFAGIVGADHASRAYETERNPIDREFQERNQERHAADIAGKSFTQRAMDFGKKERYKIVGASWIASMITAFALVNRNKYLSGQQKLVQARVYAQFLTLGVLVASAAFEISDSRNQEGRYETIRYIDPKDPEHKRMLTKQVERDSSSGGSQDESGDSMWKEMVAAEEQRLKEREEEEKRLRAHHHKKNGGGKKSSSGAQEGQKKKESDDKGSSEKESDEKASGEGKSDDKKQDKQEEGEKKKMPSANDAKAQK